MTRYKTREKPKPKEPVTVRRRYAPPPNGQKLEVAKPGKETITETIERLMNIYAESLVRFQKEPRMTQAQARQNAGGIWRAELPELTDLESVLTYIALIAWGLRLRILDTGEAKTMMFMAQTQLTALARAPAPAPIRNHDWDKKEADRLA